MQYRMIMMQSTRLIQNSALQPFQCDVKLETSMDSDEDTTMPTSRVEATSDIPLNTVSKPFIVANFSSRDTSCLDLQVFVKAANGILEADLRVENSDYTSLPVDWFKTIPFSNDCHECNVQLDLIDSEFVQLRVIKSISNGESLKLWLSQPILIALNVPFLSPVNIQGEKLYSCHLCNYTCDKPNPLKIHLALNCGEEKVSSLWKRLQTFSKTTQNANKIESNGLFFKYHDDRKIEDLKFNDSHLNFKKTAKLSDNDDKITPAINSERQNSSVNSRRGLVKRHSAFKPYSNYSIVPSWFTTQTPNENRPEIKLCQNELLVSQDLSLPSNHAVLPSCNPFLNSRLAYHSGATKLGMMYKDPLEKDGVQIFQQQAAEIETFISNLGKSKQGHLCIYCGKTYSRKYGLKIHIRTHTGFKPLKCKYCHRPFGDPSNLNKHIRLHAGGKTPYKCDMCGKVLVRRRDLEKHIKSRHYAC